MPALEPRSSEPRITAPVSRYLGAADIARTASFWRDVLGFEVRDTGDGDGSVESPARRAFAWVPRTGRRTSPARRSHPAPQSCSSRPTISRASTLPSSAGGEPSHPENVNWMKMRVFEIRDPDGHVRRPPSQLARRTRGGRQETRSCRRTPPSPDRKPRWSSAPSRNRSTEAVATCAVLGTPSPRC
jgi:hypothetical protein